MARCAWALIDDSLTEHMSMPTCPEAKEWLFHMLETLPHEEFTKIIITLWAIWSARRKAIHESIFQSPEAIHGFIMRYLADLDIIADASQKQGTTMPQSVQVQKWIPPMEGMVKINVDGGIAKNSCKGAAAAVCRDAQGVYLGSSTRIVDICDYPGTLEAMACLEALSLAADLNLRRLIIACDAEAVVKQINGGSKAIYSQILHEINIRRQEFEEVRIIHECRMSNMAAHNFVKSDLSSLMVDITDCCSRMTLQLYYQAIKRP